MLDTFHKELLDMLSEKAKPHKTHERNTILPRIVSGIFRKGIAGRKDSVEQESTGYLQQIRSLREGEKLKDGDAVEYNLCSEPNTANPSKKFWFAEDVHLKIKK